MTAAKKRFSRLVSYKAVFSSKEGKDVLKDMMRTHNLFTPTFNENSHLTAFKEGERNVILRLITILKITPDEMITIAEEIEKDARDSSQSTRNEINEPSDRINW